jgi:hypothetical protein
MLVNEIIVKAGVMAGLETYEGIAQDQNLLAVLHSIYSDCLNDLNNDSDLNLVYNYIDYQTYTEDNSATLPSAPSGTLLSILENILAQTEKSGILFPYYSPPFAVSNEYPLPKNCRRIIKAFSGVNELRKVDFSEVIRSDKSLSSARSVFAINGNRIILGTAMPLSMTYVVRYDELMPQDECPIPDEALSYLVAMLAYRAARHFSTATIDHCHSVMTESKIALKQNLRVNAGEIFTDTHATLRRFDSDAWAW